MVACQRKRRLPLRGTAWSSQRWGAISCHTSGKTGLEPARRARRRIRSGRDARALVAAARRLDGAGSPGFGGRPVQPVQDGPAELFAARPEERRPARPGQGAGRHQGAGPPLLGVVHRPRPDDDPTERSVPTLKRELGGRRSDARGLRRRPVGQRRRREPADLRVRQKPWARVSLGRPRSRAFDELDKLVENFGIAVGIHNHGPGHRYAKIETIANAIKDHHPKIGCCIDTGHFLRSRKTRSTRPMPSAAGSMACT